MKKSVMKKIFLINFLFFSLISCEKETEEKDNPRITSEINFQSTGTPIGKFNGTVSDIEGNTYKVVSIGKQAWMAENLKVSKYNDGTLIPYVSDRTQWKTLQTPAWSYPVSNEKYNQKFGKLYTWYVVEANLKSNKNVCPTGWHVPSEADWKVLVDFLGGEEVAGGKMKEVGTTTWNTPNVDANNTSLFTAISGGNRFFDGVDVNEGFSAGFWSSTSYDTIKAWYRHLNDFEGKISRYVFEKNCGFSIRCVKD
jgi:uncharacterized protein (TIGR02145 family)